MNKAIKRMLKRLGHDTFTYWNTRVIRHKIIDHFGEEESINYCYEIHEVYYDKHNNPTSWTEHPIRLYFESLEDLWGVLEHITDATSHTVLELTTTIRYEGDKLCSDDSDLVDTGKTLMELEREKREEGTD